MEKSPVTPKSSWGWVEAMLHSIYDQPDAKSVHAQFDRVVETLAEKLPSIAGHFEEARPDILAFTAFPNEIWRQIWSNNPNASTARSVVAPTSLGCSPTAAPRSGSSERPGRATRRMGRGAPLPRLDVLNRSRLA